MTTLCAAWFLRHAAAARGGELDLATSLHWQASVYAVWWPVGLLIWQTMRAMPQTARAVAALTLAGLVVVPAAAVVTTTIDTVFSGRSGIAVEAVIGRVPVMLLIYTAIVATGFAAVHRSRFVAARDRISALEDALAAARTAGRSQSEGPTANARVMVFIGRRRAPVELLEIEWFSAAGNYVVAHWNDREGLLRETLTRLEESLDPSVFARSHRSSIVNLARVVETQTLSDGSWRLTMTSGAEIVVGRTYRDTLLARLGR